MGVLLITITATFILAQKRQTIVQNASYDATTHTFTENFDGQPTSPQPLTQVGQTTWDIAIHSRDNSTFDMLESMEGHHGIDCGAPLDTSGNLVTHHIDGTYEQSVFKCKDHIMTSIKAGGYGLIELTPDVMVDFTNGEAVIKFDITTLQSSRRDWWDVRITPYSENVQLPFDDEGADLEGQPKDGVRFTLGSERQIHPRVTRNFNDDDQFQPYNGSYDSFLSYDTFLTPSPQRRDTFEIHISKTHIKACMPFYNKCWVDSDLTQPLDWTTGIVQFGHHSYNPEKDCDYYVSPIGPCGADTWHWDSFSISPSIPFGMIKGDRRMINQNGAAVNFQGPAPANANLRFSAIGLVTLSFDNGSTWVPAQIAHTKCERGTTCFHAEHLSSYWTPIPQGTQKVLFKFAKDSWYEGPFEAKDFAIWAQDPNFTPYPTFTPTPIPPTPTPLPPGTVIKMGDTIVRTEADSGNGNLLLAQKATLSQAGTLLSLSFYVTNASGNLRLGVYDASGPTGGPGQKIAETSSFAAVSGWNSANITSPVSLPVGTYWLAYLPSDNNLAFEKISNGTGGRFYSYNFGAMPQTFSTSSSSTQSNWSFYATLVSPGATITLSPTQSVPTPTLTPTPTPTKTPTPSPTPTPLPTATPTATPTPVTQKSGDANGDSKIDIQDLSFLLTHWNKNDAPTADFNHDGTINISDLSILLSNWGK